MDNLFLHQIFIQKLKILQALAQFENSHDYTPLKITELGLLLKKDLEKRHQDMEQ